MADSVEDEIDALYAGAPDEFIHARDALVKQLRAAGEKETAATVKALRRPTTAAWAVNRLARMRPDDVGALVAAGEMLRRTSERAIEGEPGAAKDMRDAGARRRDLVQRLTDAAVGLLDESGRSGEAQRDSIAATLDAASMQSEAADLVRRGRLDKELEPPSGFGELGGFLGGDSHDVPSLSTEAPTAAGEPGAPAPDVGRAARDRRRAARAERRTGAGSSDSDSAGAPRAEQQRAIAAGRERADKAAEDAQVAARELAGARREVSRLQDELVAANGRAKQAQDRATLAQWQAAQARQDLDDLERGG